MTEGDQWQRARSEAQKEERAAAILEAAAELLDESGLAGTGLNAIARRVGLSKPNLYVYFESREGILLQVLNNETKNWVKAYQKKLEPLIGTSDVIATANGFADTLYRRKRYCVLFDAMATVFEQNVGIDTVVNFKRQWLDSWQPLAETFSKVFPVLGHDRSMWCLGSMTLFAATTWGHCHPSESVKKVYELEEFCHLKLDFRTAVTQHVRSFLVGELEIAR